MVHRDCGGKLLVKESAQEEQEKGVTIRRIRKCSKCGELFCSWEFIANAKSQEGYLHKNK